MFLRNEGEIKTFSGEGNITDLVFSRPTRKEWPLYRKEAAATAGRKKDMVSKNMGTHSAMPLHLY